MHTHSQCYYNAKESKSKDLHLLTGNGLYYAMGRCHARNVLWKGFK